MGGDNLFQDLPPPNAPQIQQSSTKRPPLPPAPGLKNALKRPKLQPPPRTEDDEPEKTKTDANSSSVEPLVIEWKAPEEQKSTSPAKAATDIQSTLLDSMKSLIKDAMKKMEDRNKELLKKFEEATVRIVQSAMESIPRPTDQTIRLKEGFLAINNQMEDVKANVNQLHATLRRHEMDWTNVGRAFQEATEAEAIKTTCLLQNFSAQAAQITSEVATLQINLECLNDQATVLMNNQQQQTLQLHTMDQNIRTLCNAVYITPVQVEELNPADDNKRGEEGFTNKRNIATATVEVTKQVGSAVDEVTETKYVADEEGAGTNEEPKDVNKSNKEIVASKDSAEEQLDPFMKAKRIEDIKRKMDALKENFREYFQEEEEEEEEEEVEGEEEEEEEEEEEQED